VTINLSPHFTLQEMIRSDYALRHGLENIPGVEEIANLRILSNTVLEIVRINVRSFVLISSGYRSPEVNKGVKGSRTSQHLKGEAADFTVFDMGNLEVIRRIVHASSFIPFDQLIYEGGESGWIHISHASRGEQRREVLSADFSSGEAIYSPLSV
jgi:hypothetical protein